MTEPTRGAEISVVSGRHARLPCPVGLRRASQAVLIILVVQFSMGMILNLYVSVPSSDANAGFIQEIRTAPLALTVHAVLGLALIAGAVILLVRAVGVRDWPMTAMAAAGLVAILGAFGAGELFVRNGQNSASLTMAFLTAAALACYVAMLGRTGAVVRQSVQPKPLRATPAQPAGYSDPPVPLPSRPLPVSGPQPRLSYPSAPRQPRDLAARPQPAGSVWQQAIGQAPPGYAAQPPLGPPARRNPALPPDQPGPDFDAPDWWSRGPATRPPGSAHRRNDDMPGTW